MVGTGRKWRIPDLYWLRINLIIQTLGTPKKGVSFFILKNKEVTRYEAIEKAPFHIPCNDDLYAGNRHKFYEYRISRSEEMTAYMIDIPRSIDPQKTGWGHPALKCLGGWSIDEGNYYTVHAQDSFEGRLIYCIELGVGMYTGDQFKRRGEDYWDNYPSDRNPTISPTVIKAYIGRILQYGQQGNANVSWNSTIPAHAKELAGYIATQLLIWETIVGERDSQFNHVNANAQGKTTLRNIFSRITRYEVKFSARILKLKVK